MSNRSIDRAEKINAAAKGIQKMIDDKIFNALSGYIDGTGSKETLFTLRVRSAKKVASSGPVSHYEIEGMDGTVALVGDVQPSEARVIEGKFWTVQNAIVNPKRKDFNGKPTLNWTGRVIFTSRAEAVEVATALAKRTGGKFFIMEASTVIERDEVTVTETKL